MGNEVSNEALMGVLLDIKQDMGELKGASVAHAQALAAHILDDRLIAESVNKLQLSAAKQRGFVAAVSLVGGLIGTGIGIAADYLARGGGNH